MPGVRLQHPNLRNCTYTLVHMGRPLKRQILCPVCQQIHAHKTYHLGLDAVGEVTVSETVFQRLTEAGLDELRAVREDRKPETQRVAIGEPLVETIVVSREGGPLVKEAVNG